MSSVFVSYRRHDSSAETGRLYDRLVEQFGIANVYRDIDSTPFGADFEGVIRNRVAQCDALIAVIGPDWLGRGPDGRRRTDDPHDWVRIEIAEALTRGILVVPVLINGAAMPARDELTDDLEPLSTRQKLSLSPEAWRSQVDALVTQVDAYINPPAAFARSPLLVVASSAALSAIAGLAVIAVQLVWPVQTKEWFIVIATLNGAFSTAALAIVLSAYRRSVWRATDTVAITTAVGGFLNAVLGIAPLGGGNTYVIYAFGFGMSAFAAMLPTYSLQHIVLGTFGGALGGIVVALGFGSYVGAALSIGVYGAIVGAAIAATPRPTRRFLR